MKDSDDRMCAVHGLCEEFTKDVDCLKTGALSL